MSSKKKSMFLRAEEIASDVSLQPANLSSIFPLHSIDGLLSQEKIEEQVTFLRSLEVDDYIYHTVSPSENPRRSSASDIIRNLGGKFIHEERYGPLYYAEIEFVIKERTRRLGFLAQDRKYQMGVWYPEHHQRALEIVRFFSSHGMPLVTFMDTLGAAADESANLGNQAHSISYLISEMANLQLPSLGIVLGCGYSGGAIPLATTNILLSVKDGVFNTIHPKALSNIAHRYNLSWQECAKYVGVSSYELFQNGYFDGIIDYTPEEPHLLSNLQSAILSTIECIENNAKTYLKKNSFFFDHYHENINHYLNPSELLIKENQISDVPPTGVLNIFGSVYRLLRYLKLRGKIRSQSSWRYSRLSSVPTITGKLKERLEQERKQKLNHWLSDPLEIRYNERLQKCLRELIEHEKMVRKGQGKFSTWLKGDPQKQYEEATSQLNFEILFYLYNYWKSETYEYLIPLFQYLESKKRIPITEVQNPNLLDLLQDPMIFQYFEESFPNILLFDLLFDSVVENLLLIAAELQGSNQISRDSVERLFETAIKSAFHSFSSRSLDFQSQNTVPQFFQWLSFLITRDNCDEMMRTISEWKQHAFPRKNPALFALVRYFFAELLPALPASEKHPEQFNGQIDLRNIGIQDFWNHLDQSYKDLQIQQLIRDYKQQHITPETILKEFFTNFKELYGNRMTREAVNFPGFRRSIENALSKKITPCGIITGLATYQDGERKSRVGVVISNTRFQAGAFDMASCEKVCKLLVECARKRIPVVMFISSGGMQTKEGAGALFSMAVINDRITRFVKDMDLPVICFGFRDCTGGAQASFVTHRFVKTYYFSGAVMPFAGQLVVESPLSTKATVANYLSNLAESMEGLVINPFDEEIDQKLRTIDPHMPIAEISVREVINRVLDGEYRATVQEEEQVPTVQDELHLHTINRLLIHARGCTANRLIQSAHQAEIPVVLVQSDADIDSYPTQLLNQEKDRLICIGGNTPQESYLNAMSVILIAEQEQADALHPGIGFLSESSDYARLCRAHGINFIGPRAQNMELMGNKSNAIATAKRLEIPVVPGSEGALADPTDAQIVAEEIGFPVLIKAAHGGGGKGIGLAATSEEFLPLFSRMSQEALNAFGNGDLYLEKYIVSMRHIEVQVLQDSYNHCKIMGFRDCSVQRSFQKLIEESADDTLPQHLKEELYSHSERIVKEIDYIGLGTVEFIYDVVNERVYFMEMNTRLQVEHPVTEMVTTVDLVQKQFEVASGKSIESLEFQNKGHAIEIRINAESIEIGNEGQPVFIPNPGKITRFHFPQEKYVRVLGAVQEGSIIPPYYDSLVVQLIVWGKTRNAAIRRMIQYLDRVELEGVSTSIPLMKQILKNPQFQQGNYDTQFLPQFLQEISIENLIAETKSFSGQNHLVLNEESLQIDDSNEMKVLSHQLARFYLNSSPSDPPYITEGQIIDCDQTLFLLESMKVFQECSLSSYQQGEQAMYNAPRYCVKKIIAESGQTVNQGDLLLIIEPV